MTKEPQVKILSVHDLHCTDYWSFPKDLKKDFECYSKNA